MSRRRRLLVLAICCLSLFIVGLDNTIVNLALPSIHADLHSSVSGLQWTVDAYLLVLASLLILSGSTADRIGRKRTFQTGLTLFSLGSLLCSVAPNTGLLITFRAVQAVGGSMLNPVAMSIITNTFLDPRERSKAIGLWGGVMGLSMALGPVLGGVLVEAAGWRSVFWVNVPVGIAGVLLTARYVPESRAARPRRIDPVGQVLIALTLATLTYGIIEGPGAGWTSPWILGAFVVAVAAGVAFVRYERRCPEPLLDLGFFRSIPFSGATVMAVCGNATLAGFLFLNALYLQSARGFAPLLAGLLTLPMAAMMAGCAALAGRTVAARGPRSALLTSGTAIVLGAVLLTTLGPDTSLIHLVLAYLLLGIGFGSLNAPITDAAVSGMPREQAGVAAAIASTSRQVGSSLGVAVLGTVVTAGIAAGPLASTFGPASVPGWWIMAGCGAMVFALGLVTTSRWARASVLVTEPEPVRG